MKKISILLVLFMTLLLVGCGEKKVDITDTGFEYDVPVCNEYFKLVDCIIEKDTNENYNNGMREELRVEIKKVQENWKLLNEDELNKKCVETLENLKGDLKERNLDSFGCL